MSGRSIIGALANDGGGGGSLVEAVKSLSAASSYSIAIPAATFRRIDVYISGLGGMTVGFGSGVLARLNADSTAAHYGWIGSWNQNSSGGIVAGSSNAGTAGLTTAVLTALTGASPASSVDVTLRIRPLVGRNRTIESIFESNGSAATTDIEGNITGWWLNTVTDVTSVDLVFGSAFTGTVETRGIYI